jgi:glycosyltransferase involved in cell wall biosynthesis
MYTPTASGGHPRYSKELLTALAGAERDGGLRVSLVTAENLDPAFDTQSYPIHRVLPALQPHDQFGSRVSWLASRLLHYWKQDRSFYRWISAEPDEKIVHFQEMTLWSAYGHIRRLQRAGIRVFYTVHNVRWHEYPRFLPPAVAERIRRRYLRACDGLMVHSDALKQALSQMLGEGHPPIYVTPHGAWSASSQEAPVRDVSSQLALKRLLFFGIIGHYKGVHVLLDAMKLLPDDFTLTIAGRPNSASYHEQLREQIAGFPPGRVEFIDRFVADEEIPGLFAKSSLLVLPYVNFNAQSGVLHDALAWGLPVVGTDVGAIGTSIREWRIGEVVTPDNAEQLAAGILRMFEPDRYTAAMTGIERARQELSWDRTAEATIAGYKAVVGDWSISS